MIEGYFSDKGELYFEIELMADDGSAISVNALLDKGFTDWLVMDIQDIESLGWSFQGNQEMRTARGQANFRSYEGRVNLDGREFTILALGGKQITEVLIGLPWLEERRLVVDRKASLLTLGDD